MNTLRTAMKHLSLIAFAITAFSVTGFGQTIIKEKTKTKIERVTTPSATTQVKIKEEGNASTAATRRVTYTHHAAYASARVHRMNNTSAHRAYKKHYRTFRYRRAQISHHYARHTYMGHYVKHHKKPVHYKEYKRVVKHHNGSTKIKTKIER